MQASLVLDIIQRGRPCPHVLPASVMMQCGCGSTVDHSTRTHQGTLHEGSSASCRAVVHCQTHWRLISVLDGRERIRRHTSRSLSAHLMLPSAWPCHVMLPRSCQWFLLPMIPPPKRHRARWPGRLSQSQTAASVRGPRQAWILPACPRKSQSSRNQ